MGGQGREALTMESTDSQNISFRREKGCFLSTCTIFSLLLVVVAAIIATGVLVYYFAERPQQIGEKSPAIEYEVVQKDDAVPTRARSNLETVHRPLVDEDHVHDHDHHHDHSHDHSKMDEEAKGDEEMVMMKKKKKEKIDVRLPRSLKPLHYFVKLIPYIGGNFSISGHVSLTFEVLENTDNVTLHINGIITKNDTIKVVSASDPQGKENPIAKHMYDKERQFYIAKLREVLQKGQTYIIMIDFTGYLSKDMNGFYRSSYKDENGEKRWLAATQFQPTDARKAFPCMDEPALKASFTIQLGRQTNMTSISNMPINETTPMEGQTEWMWDKFEKSVEMSTYLVAFVVSDFQYIESTDQMKYKFRVWSRKNSIHQADYAMKIGAPTSRYFEEFFNVSFPLPKQDMIALPDFSAGAMENWGLITYRETALLYDPDSTPARSKFYITAVIAHELAHQWFGNLVTPFWWTDLWLNEGFASYMEYIGANAVEPTWKMMEQFVIADLHPVFGLDCLESSHPINIPVDHPDEISEIFDRISYLKGSSIIRMMSNFLTEETFRRGLTKYLTGLAYKSAVQDDLWRYLTAQAHEDGTLSKDLNVKTIMDTWTLQMGFPVITVTRNENGMTTLKQERFLLVKNKSSNNTHDYKWWVPITFSTEANPNFSMTSPKLWMKPTESMKMIDDVPSTGWVVFNNHQTGYYRVNYDAKNWEFIIDQLLRDHTQISIINRAQIIDDSMALARAGLLPYQIPFKILSYLKNEKDFVPWKAALKSLGFIQTMFKYTGGYGALKEFILSLILPIYNEIGFNDSTSDPFLDQMIRSNILAKACYLDHRPCVLEAVNLFNKWKETPDVKNLISPNLKQFVYCVAIQEGNYEDWKFAWKMYQMSNTASEKRLLLGALGCSKEPWILNGYLNRSLHDGKGIRKQDTSTVINSVSYSTNGKLIAWQFLKDKWMAIKDYFGSVSFTLNSIVKSTTSSLNTKTQIEEFEIFFKKFDGQFGSAQRAAEQAFENAQNNLKWMDDYYHQILDWLTKNGYENNI